jgi:hypothetical protein
LQEVRKRKMNGGPATSYQVRDGREAETKATVNTEHYKKSI